MSDALLARFFEYVVHGSVEDAVEIAGLLADVDYTDNDGLSPLQHAVENKDGPMIHALIRLGADPSADSEVMLSAWDSAMVSALFEDDLELLNILIHAKIPLNPQDPRTGATLLMRAANADLKTLQTLIAAGAPLEDKDKYGDTAIMYSLLQTSCFKEHELVDRLQLLVSAGAQTDIVNHDGESLYDRARRIDEPHRSKVIDLLP